MATAGGDSEAGDAAAAATVLAEVVSEEQVIA